jgi:hypothetical protein
MAGNRTSRAGQIAFPWRALRTLREILSLTLVTSCDALREPIPLSCALEGTPQEEPSRGNQEEAAQQAQAKS